MRESRLECRLRSSRALHSGSPRSARDDTESFASMEADDPRSPGRGHALGHPMTVVARELGDAVRDDKSNRGNNPTPGGHKLERGLQPFRLYFVIEGDATCAPGGERQRR